MKFEDKLLALKEYILLANPKIEQWNESMQRFLSHVKPGSGFLDAEDITFWNNDLYRKITLADVLLAMKLSDREFGFSTAFSENNQISQVVAAWDLANDNLAYQSEALKKHLYDLLLG